jgi:hypothetical protein
MHLQAVRSQSMPADISLFCICIPYSCGEAVLLSYSSSEVLVSDAFEIQPFFSIVLTLSALSSLQLW